MSRADFIAKEDFILDKADLLTAYEEFAKGIKKEVKYDNEVVDVKPIIAQLKKNKDKLKLTKDEKHYVDDDGKLYQRVTSYIQKEEIVENEMLKSASVIGTAFDTMIRDFFNQNHKFNEKDYDVIKGDEKAKFIKQMTELREDFKKKGETVVSEDILLFDKELGIAGTVDILTYDKLGNFRIYDMKTMKTDQFLATSRGQKYDSTTVFKDTGKKKDNGDPKFDVVPGATTDSKRTKHSKQLSLYSELLKRQTNKGAVDISIIPIKVDYATGDKVSTEGDLRSIVPLKHLSKVEGVKINKTLEIKRSRKVKSSSVVSRGQDYTSSVGPTNQRKLYEDIYEVEKGKATGYYTRPLYNSFYEKQSDFWRKFNELKDKWEDDNADKTKAQKRKLRKGAEHTKLMKAWIKEHYKDQTIGIEESNAKKEYKNPAYDRVQKDERKKKAYDFLIEFNRESDEMVTGRGKLYYKLPAQTKNNSQLLTDVGLLGAISQKASDSLKLKLDDVNAGELEKIDGDVRVRTDADGKPLKRINIAFRGDLDMKDQSFDLMGMALTNRYVSRNFKEKTRIKADLEVIRDLMAERQVVAKKGSKTIVKQLQNKLKIGTEEAREIVHTESGMSSNAMRLYDSLLDDRLYGKHDKEGSEILHKLSNQAIAWSSHTMLIANWLGGGVNFLAGKTQNFLHSVGNEHYGVKNLAHAEAKYFKGVVNGSTISDIGAIRDKSRVNLFFDKFMDTANGWDGMINDLTTDNRVKDLFSMKTLHGINTTAEHYIQGTLMYGVLDNIKVTNKKGQFVDINGKVVQDRQKAATMDEMYEVVNGVLQWKDHNFTVEGFEDMNQETEFMIEARIKDIAADAQGNYDATNKSMIQREWYGKLGFFLRKWIIRGTQARWRGIENTDKAFHELEEHQKGYTETSQSYKEGSYTAAVRFVRQTVKNLDSFKTSLLRLEWDKLSDREKGLIQKAVWEVSVMSACLLASSLLAKMALEDDDDPNSPAWIAAYLLRRQASELIVYTPLGLKDGIKTVTTPTAVSSTLIKSIDALQQGFSDILSGEFDKYQSGKNKDRYKLFVKVAKVTIPGFNGYNGDAKGGVEFLNK